MLIWTRKDSLQWGRWCRFAAVDSDAAVLLYLCTLTQGLQYIDGLYAGYGEGGKGDGSDGRGPNQNRINRQGNQYLDEVFPKLSYIVQARILDEANLTQR